ncbi:MAG: hypothetical protein DBY25_02225 [Clostridiales bacterium]|nr:MAG: hypothetical protein DBY25_02225 [Clostridiales bacterium]
MKRLTLIVIALLLCISFTACNVAEDAEGLSTSSSSSSDLPAYPYTYDRYAVPAAVRTSLGGSYETYKAAVDAIDSAAESFAVTDEAEYETVCAALEACYPPYGLVTGANYDAASKEVHLSYRYNATVMQQQVEKTDQLSGMIMALALREGDDELNRALALYHYVITSIHMDGSDSSLWVGLMDGTGGSYAAAAMYSFLLTQVDVESVLAVTTDHENKDHYLVIVTLNGKPYIMDPAYELEFSKGGLVCFGMTEQELTANRLAIPVKALFGQTPACTDVRFASMRQCAKWSFNEDRTRVSMTVDGSTQIFDPTEEGN